MFTYTYYSDILHCKLRLAEMSKAHSKEMLDAEAKLKQLEEEKDNLASNHAKEKEESEHR